MTEKKGLLSNNTEAEYFSDFTPNSNKSLTWHNINLIDDQQSNVKNFPSFLFKSTTPFKLEDIIR